MKRYVAACLLAASLAACDTGTRKPTNAAFLVPNDSASAAASMTFRVPVNYSGYRVPSVLGAKPEFLSGNSTGGVTVFFDGQKVMDNVSFAPGTAATPAPTSTGASGTVALPNGGSFAYTSTYELNPAGGNQEYAVITANYTAVPGIHNLAVVQTNGPCVADSYGRQSCIAGNNGYVLAEGQTMFKLQPGDNGSQSLTLRGVMESAYLCDAACDGTAGPYNNGYSITVMVADESGVAIPQQVDTNGGIAPFDNGSYQIVEADANNIVTITQPAASYSTPGNAKHSSYGVNIGLVCNKVGTTTVIAKLLTTNPTKGIINGFAYSAQNYPQPGDILANVGADEYYGNTLSVNCSATGQLTIN